MILALSFPPFYQRHSAGLRGEFYNVCSGLPEQAIHTKTFASSTMCPLTSLARVFKQWLLSLVQSTAEKKECFQTQSDLKILT